MSQAPVEVQGVLQADGTLTLDEKPNLPAGRVKVTLQALGQAGPRPDALAALEEIWAERKARGMQPRSAEEIDAQINAMRDEWEERQQALERIRQERRFAGEEV